MAGQNVTPPLNAPARLAILLPWINGDRLSRQDICSGIGRFFLAGTASDAIAVYASRRGNAWTGGIANFSDEELDRLRRDVHALLDDTTRHRSINHETMASLPSLRYAIGRVRSAAKL